MIEFLLSLIKSNPEALLAVLAAVVVAVVALLYPRFSRAQQDHILAATKGFYAVIAAISHTTPFTWDDAVAAIVKKAEQEMQRKLKPKEVARVRGIATALLADPGKPDIAGVDKTMVLVREMAGV